MRPLPTAALRISTPITMMSQPPAASDDSVPMPEALVMIPDCFPSFGMTARESMRFDYMIRREEPLLQEVLGLQFLFITIGSQLNGLCGAIIGFGQVAPLMSFVPGRAGCALRSAGWHVFTAVVRLAFLIDSSGRQARLYSSRLDRAWKRATSGLAGKLRGLRRPRADRWPSLAGAPTYHPKRGPRPPPPPREPWEPPPGWTPPTKPLWPAVARGWARGESAPLLVTVAADDLLWASGRATAAANEALLTSLDAAGVETTVETLDMRMSVLRAAGSVAQGGGSRAQDAGSAGSAAAPASRLDVRVQAIQQLIELQLIRDGLDPDRLHLVGGDEPDEEARYFEEGWRFAWGKQAKAGVSGAAVAALEGLRGQQQWTAASGGVHIGVLTTAPEGSAPLMAIERAADFVIGAESGQDVLPAVAGRCPNDPEQSMWKSLFDVALRRCEADCRRAEQLITSVAGEPASALEGAPPAALRWVHISSDARRGLVTAKALGARTIWVRPRDEEYDLAASDAADVQLADVSDLARALQTVTALADAEQQLQA